MHYNFARLDGLEWYKLIKRLFRMKLEFIEVESKDLFNPLMVSDVFKVYFNRTTSNCRIIFYEYEEGKWKKKLRQISFSPKEIDPVQCVLDFRKIASKYEENIGYEPHYRYSNGVYSFYKGGYKGEVTVLDMNSAYLWALSQPLADWTTKTRVKSTKEIWSKEYDYYLFENELHHEMVYKEDIYKLQGCTLWADLKIYGFKAKLYYQETCKELYRLKQVNKDRYKNVANVAVGCMHKRSGEQNNTTMAASLYAYFEWYIKSLVEKFENYNYNVIMITTDSIKIKGDYNEDDHVVTLGDGLGEFKVEYKGPAVYESEGHYEENKVKWKGKPQYMIEGHPKCQFVSNIEKEKKIYEKYAIK